MRATLRSVTTEDPRPTEVSADVLLRRLADVGGSLKLTGLTAEERAAWQRAGKTAQLRLWRVGRTKLIRYSTPDALSFRLVEESTDRPQLGADDPAKHAPWQPPPRKPPPDYSERVVRVPSRIREMHQLVKRVQEAFERLDKFDPFRLGRSYRPESWLPDVPENKRGRVLRIWQAFIDEALYREWRVWEAGHRSSSAVTVDLGRESYPITLLGSHAGLWLRIETGRRGKRDTWSDSPNRRLEEKLGEVFARLNELDREGRAREEQERREAAERARRRELALAQAAREFTEQHRRDTIAQRVEDATLADNVRAYSAALLASADQLEPERAADVGAWATWAAGYADRIDHRRNGAGAPVVPKPTTEDLKHFLRGSDRFLV